jgi:hypothetical protein
MSSVLYARQLEAERRYPDKVDVPVPLGGLGERLTDMLEWCGDRGGPQYWDCHGITDWQRRDARGAAMDFARFYFLLRG